MKKYVMILSLCLLASGCASDAFTRKSFNVIADPPDSVIKVVSGIGLKEQRYHSPATITAEIPHDSVLAAKAILEISKDRYKPATIALRLINDGETIKVKLDALAQYRLKYRLLLPVQSDELRFQDKALSVSFSVGEQSFRLNLKNLTSFPLKIHWEQTEYTDIFGRRHRLMHSGVRYQDRNNPIPDQDIMPGNSIQEDITPVSSVYVSPQTKGYEVKSLFPPDAGSALKGKIFNLFLPVEINRSITPYYFKFVITGAVKDVVKQ